MSVSVKVSGVEQAKEDLAGFAQPQLDRSLRKVMLSGARAMVAPIRKEAPVGRAGRRTPKRGGAQGRIILPGSLRKSVQARKAERGLGGVVGPVAKLAPHRHLVIQGTAPHRIPKGKAKTLMSFMGTLTTHVDHPGAKPNPFVDRAFAAGEERIDKFIARAVDRELAKAGKAKP